MADKNVYMSHVGIHSMWRVVAAHGVRAGVLGGLGVAASVASICAAGVVAWYLGAEWKWSEPSRAGELPLVAAHVALPVVGTTALLAFVALGITMTGRAFRPLYGWLAAGCSILLLASLSASSHYGLIWTEDFERADTIGYAEAMPVHEILLMLAPFVTVPLFVILGTMCLDRWAGDKKAIADRAVASHTR